MRGKAWIVAATVAAMTGAATAGCSGGSSVTNEVTETQLGIIAKQLDMYRVRTREYPATLGELIAAKMLRQRQDHDPWDRPLVYERSGRGFVLCSRGADPDTPDDDICHRK